MNQDKNKQNNSYFSLLEVGIDNAIVFTLIHSFT